MDIIGIGNNLFEIKDRPCEGCGSIEYLHIEGSPEEYSGFECHDCGKGFIQDKVQETHEPPLSVLETMYIEEE